MIKKIFCIADVHIPNYRRMEEYVEQLNKLIEDIRLKSSVLKYDDMRILILGDLFHMKNNISSELITMSSNFIRKLEEIAPVICIAGNHDLVLQNQNRLDAITGLFKTADFGKSTLLDMQLGYDSGIVEDDNIIWALWSIYNDYFPINIKDIKEEYSDKVIIGLVHGTIVGCTMANGYGADRGINGDMFEGCDIVMAGDIHKRQILKRKDTEIIYPGSLLQQNFGETISSHGYCILDIDDKNITYNFVDISSDYGFYNIELNDIDDIDEDKEKLINI